ncbi:MAG: hypothetical protein ABJA57_00025 [Ginsengibacter sp.]
MKKNVFFRLFALVLFCIPAPAIKSEQSLCTKKASKISMTQMMVDPRVEFASYKSGPLPPDDGFMIKI